ncbi:MAG: hypothetical protein OER56_00960 [Hyphomicrobiales bacterium]|nr:hypothetical protein [Hyphomicrobiales bacterium]
MTLVASFLGGAKSRLLPASIPFRYFAAAASFHILAWLVLLTAADELPGFTGGPGKLLAAIHLLTLGVLVMTAMGAAFQLLPVATRRPLSQTWPARLSFWLLTPGTLGLAYGMATGSETAMVASGGSATASFGIFAFVIADNLRRANDLPIVAAHGWGAIVSLAGFAGLGLALIADFYTGFLPNHQSFALAHLILAGFGFMGLLAFGLSHVLIPMFALSRTLPSHLGWLEFWLACTGCALATAAALTDNPIGLAAASVVGLCASGIYLWLMRTALQTGMRKRLGLSFILIKLSWGALMVCLSLGLAIALGAPIPNGATLFGFVLLAGWLLTFLTGILQRIMPFLASMHAAGKGGKPALLSELTADLPLKVHAGCHISAVLFCSLGITMNMGTLVQLGAILGLAGALAFAAFAFLIVIKLNQTAG